MCKEVDGVANYITIEHLKIPTDNKDIRELFEPIDKDRYYRPSSLRNYELTKEHKVENINSIKDVVKKSIIGVGDNDLHYMSQSRNCCGVDTIGGAFDNYLKYNLTYFSTSNDTEEDIANFENVYIPENSVSSVFNSDTRLVGVKDFKTYTDHYCNAKCEFFRDGCVKNHFESMDFSKYIKKNGRNKESE